MIELKNKKRLAIIDSSFSRPVQFSLSEGDLIQEDLYEFCDNLDVYFYNTSLNMHEFMSGYASQPSLFAQPISVASYSMIQSSKVIYLSNNGDFSLTAGINKPLPIAIYDSEINQNQPTLWQHSFQWRERLSFEDKNIISLASTLSSTYEGVAVLTNDWALRQQCNLYEGIDVYGTCSMLAGLALSNVITYQKGTFIYKTWFNEEPRWVPTNLLERRKWTFKEVLDFERERIKQRKSFWINP